MLEYLVCCFDLILHFLRKPANRWGAFIALPIVIAIALLLPTLLYALLSQAVLLLLMAYLRPMWIVEFMHWTNLRKNDYTVKYQTVGDFTFCYAEKGMPSPNQASIVFFHGLSATKDMWFPMVTAIPADRHVILLDMPGHGDSTQRMDDSYSFVDQASRIAQFFIAVGLKPFHLVGISMGGGVAVAYAGLFPKDVAVLSLLCPAGLPGHEASEYLRDVGRGLIKVDRGKLPINATEQHKAFAYVFHAQKGTTVARLYSWFAFEVLRPRQVMHCKVTKDLEEDVNSRVLLDYLPRIRAPTQVLWGKHDRLVHISGADVLKSALPDCEVHVLPKCGHTITYDRPFRAVKLILEFGNKK